MASVNAKSSLATAGARAVYQDFRRYFMRRRPDWNRMGPRLPLWFRLRLKRVDPKLVLQYVPPKSKDAKGLPDARFPNGAWYICGRLRHNRHWISKRAVFVLTDQQGRLAAPSHELIRVLRMARNERRNQGVDTLEVRFEASVAAMAAEDRAQAREDLMERIVATMRRLNMSSYARPRVFFPAPPAG